MKSSELMYLRPVSCEFIKSHLIHTAHPVYHYKQAYIGTAMAQISSDEP